MKIWDIPSNYVKYEANRRTSDDQDSPATDLLLYALEQWISLPTVSGDPKYLDECRQGARFFKSVLKQLGADSRMIPGAPGKNPLVYGKFTANAYLSQKSGSSATLNAKVPTVLFYGHYDVISVEHEKENWISNPFKLTGRDGYLYARGVTDNKVRKENMPLLGNENTGETHHIFHRVPYWRLFSQFQILSRKVYLMSMSSFWWKERRRAVALDLQALQRNTR
jgi:hypothetical protein